MDFEDNELKNNLQGKSTEFPLINKNNDMNLNQSPKGMNLFKQFLKTSIKNSVNPEVRNKFQLMIGKLNDNSTKEIAFRELKQLILQNITQEDLRTYISSLSIFYKNCTLAAKEIQVLLIGYIATVFKENLLDPLDKTPSILSTIRRIIEIIKNFMKENSYGIHKACSHSILEIFENSMPKDNDTQILKYFYDNFSEVILTGVNSVSKIGVSIYLNDFISYLITNKMNSCLKNLVPKYISMIFKTKNDSSYLYEGLSQLIENTDFTFFTEILKEIYEKFIEILNTTQNFKTKIEVCRCFEIIARKIFQNKEQLIWFYNKDVINILVSTSKDKFNKVQISANNALKYWNQVEQLYLKQENQKTSIDNSKTKLAPLIDHNEEINYTSENQIERRPSKLNVLRNICKINKFKSPEKTKNEIYSKGMTNLIRTSSFLNTREKRCESSNLNVKPINIKNDHNKQQTLQDFMKYKKSQMKDKNMNEEEDDVIRVESEENFFPQKKPKNQNFLNELKINSGNFLNSILNEFQNNFENKMNQLDQKLKHLKEKVTHLSYKIRKNKKNSKNDKTRNFDSNLTPKITDQTIETKNTILVKVYDKDEEVKNKNNYEEEKIGSKINTLWDKAQTLLSGNNINHSYRLILDSGDDLFFLRLLFMTGPALNSLNIDLSKRVIEKILMITRSKLIDDLTFDIINQAYELNIYNYLNSDFQNDILDTLFDMSKSSNSIFSKKSYDLYQEILKSSDEN